MLCGSSRRIINPEISHRLSGYGQDYPCEGIHDDLSLTCLYLNDSEGEAVFVTYDLVAMKRVFIDLLRDAISNAAGVALESVFLHNTHVHSGPIILREPEELPEHEIEQHALYKKNLVELSVAAALDAKENAEECELLYNYAHVSENMNRRFFLPSRESIFIPLAKQLVGQSTEYVDEELGIVAFKKKGTPNKYKAIISNYTAHPLCVGNASNQATADYQGYIRKTVEDTLGGALCITTTGAAGDHHPRKPESGFAEAERMGTALGTVVIERLYDAVPCPDTSLRMAYKNITLKGAESGELETCYSILGIGPIAFCGMPGELAAILGAQIKYSSVFLKNFVTHVSTDCISYMSARNQFYWGGYEPGSSLIAPGEAEVLVHDLIATAENLVAEKPFILEDVKMWDGRH